MDEQRLRRALREHAARLPTDRPSANRLIGRARRRAVAVLAVAILVATAGAVVGVTALDPDPGVVVGPGPTETRRPDDAGSPSADRASAGPSEGGIPAGPYRAFALYEDRSGVYALDLQTGQRPRRVDAAPTGEGIVDIAYSRPRDSLFVTVGETACRNRIFEMSLADGSRREIGAGREIAVDPHGTRYVIARSTGGCGEEELAVELGSFEGGTSRTWSVPVEEEGPVALSHLGWSQGEEYVAFELEYGDGTEIHLLDVTRTDTASLEEATTELSPPTERPVTWTAPAFRGSALTVVEGPALGYEQEVDGWQVIEIDPPNRQPARPVVGSDRAITHLDWGPAGHRLLYTLGHGVHDAEARPAQVRLWSDEGDDLPLPDGMREAIWGAQ